MNNWIYITPDKQYGIQKINSLFFGPDISKYVLCVFNPMLFQWDGFYVFRPEETLRDCFAWLFKHDKITNEEYDLNIDKLKKA